MWNEVKSPLQVFASQADCLIMSGMPTVLRQGGFAVMIPVDNHLPPHVHVKKAGKELVVIIGDEHHRPVVRKNSGMSQSEIDAALRLINKYQEKLLDDWREIHG